MVANTSYNQLGQLAAVPGYSATPQASAIVPGQTSYLALAQAAEQERQLNMQRAAAQQNAVIGGYDQQITNARMLGDQGYANLATNYDAVAADAMATRERNMGRIDQYGNSMRQDLAIKGQQALASANQSAIKRGLGNTTIADSLVRGQTFDNTRQYMTLEDQLLQNKIATDANLSNAYQSTLQNRAQALAAQWNQNMANENQLTTNRLGYIGGIQDDTQGFQNVAGLYSQRWQMENANNQAALQREAQFPTPKPKSTVRLGMPWKFQASTRLFA
jgi:hypothetical protein